MTFTTWVPKQEYICAKGTCVSTSKSLLQTAPIETHDTIERAWACYCLKLSEQHWGACSRDTEWTDDMPVQTKLYQRGWLSVSEGLLGLGIPRSYSIILNNSPSHSDFAQQVGIRHKKIKNKLEYAPGDLHTTYIIH